VAGSIVRVGQAVQPVVNLLRDELLDSPLVFGDETELQVLKEPGRSAQAKSYIWAQMTDGCGKDGTGPPIRMFTYSPSRSTNTAMQLPLPLPTGLGHEAVGVIEALGEGVQDLAVGDRVVYMNAGVGAYASHRNVEATKLVKLPASVSDEDAAAVFFKAMTAQYLLRRTYRVEPGDIVLVHAAAGGVWADPVPMGA
jgi:hypothetical protein